MSASDVSRIALSSMTTHGALECIDACKLMSSILYRAFQGYSKDQILNQSNLTFESKKIQAIAYGCYRGFEADDCISTGYVVTTLETALWCFDHSESFEEAVLKAVNLGGDADTIAAVTGQIAGAYYGVEEIPKRWIQKTYKSNQIVQLVEELYKGPL